MKYDSIKHKLLERLFPFVKVKIYKIVRKGHVAEYERVLLCRIELPCIQMFVLWTSNELAQILRFFAKRIHAEGGTLLYKRLGLN